MAKGLIDVEVIKQSAWKRKPSMLEEKLVTFFDLQQAAKERLISVWLSVNLCYGLHFEVMVIPLAQSDMGWEGRAAWVMHLIRYCSICGNKCGRLSDSLPPCHVSSPLPARLPPALLVSALSSSFTAALQFPPKFFTASPLLLQHRAFFLKHSSYLVSLHHTHCIILLDKSQHYQIPSFTLMPDYFSSRSLLFIQPVCSLFFGRHCLPLTSLTCLAWAWCCWCCRVQVDLDLICSYIATLLCKINVFIPLLQGVSFFLSLKTMVMKMQHILLKLI